MGPERHCVKPRYKASPCQPSDWRSALEYGDGEWQYKARGLGRFIEDSEDELTRDSNAVVDLVHEGNLDQAEQAARDLLERYPEVHDGYDRLGMGTRHAASESKPQTATARSSSSCAPIQINTIPSSTRPSSA